MRCALTHTVGLKSTVSFLWLKYDCFPGSKLGLLTRGPNLSHLFRIYDVARRDGHPTMTTSLESFPANLEGEVNCAAFSSDGIYLALARNDNRTHVYDTRMLERGVLHNFVHLGASRVNPGHESYGVVQAQWVETNTRRQGLVTGGDDGELWSQLIFWFVK